jgi:predicted phage tail protein
MPKGFSKALKPPKGQGFAKKKKPQEDAESGFSSAYAKLVGVLSEGPIEGPIGWTQGIFFDETPLSNADNTFNFQGLTFDFRNGTSEQAGIPGFTADATSETVVGSEVKFNLPITRTINNANLDQIIVRLAFQLQEFPPEGGYKALPVEFRILIKEGLGPFVERHRQTLQQRFSSAVELEFGFNVDNVGGTVNTFQVRVERLTVQDADTTRYQRVINFRAYSQVVGTRTTYPFSAIAALQFEAAQFDSLPQVAFKIGGRLIQIPSNATVATDRGLDYSGTWDGTFIQAPIACADPAWIFYDLCTNKRYGLGKYIDPSKINKWTLYELSLYCNELLSIGGDAYAPVYERRYQCHVLIQDKEDAWRVLDALRSIFRGFLYWLEGAVHISADRPGNPSMIVSQADIEDGAFSYTRTPLRSRHTIARVTWLDPDNFYKRTIESVEDQIGIERYGVRELEISAFGCTSRSQAHRAGWAALLSDRLELETVRFRIRPYGAYAVPGQIIKTMDVKRSIVRFGGLVVSATESTVTLDHPVELLIGETYTITLMLPDGSIIERSVYNAAGVHSILDFEALNYSQPIPLSESPWILTSGTVQPGLYRILSVVPVSGENNLLYEIAALEYHAEKYTKIDTDYYVPPIPPVPKPPAVVPPPINLAGTVQQSIAASLLTATWEAPPNNEFITGYIAQYRLPGGEWSTSVSIAYPSASWDTIISPTYEVRVASVDVFGAVSSWVTATIVAAQININYDWSIGESMLTPMFF